MVNNVHRHLEGDYSSGPWKYTPQKLKTRRYPSGWWILPGVAMGSLIILAALWAAGVV